MKKCPIDNRIEAGRGCPPCFGYPDECDELVPCPYCKEERDKEEGKRTNEETD